MIRPGRSFAASNNMKERERTGPHWLSGMYAPVCIRLRLVVSFMKIKRWLLAAILKKKTPPRHLIICMCIHVYMQVHRARASGFWCGINTGMRRCRICPRLQFSGSSFLLGLLFAWMLSAVQQWRLQPCVFGKVCYIDMCLFSNVLITIRLPAFTHVSYNLSIWTCFRVLGPARYRRCITRSLLI